MGRAAGGVEGLGDLGVVEAGLAGGGGVVDLGRHRGEQRGDRGVLADRLGDQVDGASPGQERGDVEPPAGRRQQAKAAGFAFRAVAADSAYGDQDGFRSELSEAGLPFVMALKPRRGTWAYGPDARTPVDAARELRWSGPDDPGDWHPVARIFRDGHAGTWHAADATLGWWGPDGARRLVVAAADPGTLPAKATWHLVTNLPRPGGPREAGSPHPAAGLAEIVRIYGIRHWIEQSYKQVKDELGWADFQVRSDIAIRRHQVLVNCAFSFCRDAWFAHPAPAATPPAPDADGGERGPAPAAPNQSPPSWPRALRAVRAWLAPWIALRRWWTAWSNAPPPRQLQDLMTSLRAGHGLHLYIPN
jgi:hypothetical protein